MWMFWGSHPKDQRREFVKDKQKEKEKEKENNKQEKKKKELKHKLDPNRKKLVNKFLKVLKDLVMSAKRSEEIRKILSNK